MASDIISDKSAEIPLGVGRLMQSNNFFGMYYRGAPGNGSQAWCNTGPQALRGPQVMNEPPCRDAFDAFADSSYTYLGTLTTSDP